MPIYCTSICCRLTRYVGASSHPDLLRSRHGNRGFDSQEVKQRGEAAIRLGLRHGVAHRSQVGDHVEIAEDLRLWGEHSDEVGVAGHDENWVGEPRLHQLSELDALWLAIE